MCILCVYMRVYIYTYTYSCIYLHTYVCIIISLFTACTKLTKVSQINQPGLTTLRLTSHKSGVGDLQSVESICSFKQLFPARSGRFLGSLQHPTVAVLAKKVVPGTRT